MHYRLTYPLYILCLNFKEDALRPSLLICCLVHSSQRLKNYFVLPYQSSTLQQKNKKNSAVK